MYLNGFLFTALFPCILSLHDLCDESLLRTHVLIQAGHVIWNVAVSRKRKGKGKRKYGKIKMRTEWRNDASENQGSLGQASVYTHAFHKLYNTCRVTLNRTAASGTPSWVTGPFKICFSWTSSQLPSSVKQNCKFLKASHWYFLLLVTKLKSPKELPLSKHRNLGSKKDKKGR